MFLILVQELPDHIVTAIKLGSNLGQATAIGNHPADNPVIQLFASNSLEEFAQRDIEPWTAYYLQIKYPCTDSALIAMLAEKIYSKIKMLGGEPNVVKMERIHKELGPRYQF